MSRIGPYFQQLADRGEKALVAYVTAGDPDRDRSFAVLDALCRGGADVLELGVPFSDPTADGPAIQRASGRSLASGTTVATVLDLVRQVRAHHQQPIVLFGYYNPFLQYGLARLVKDAALAGADAFLVVDLPPEEAGEFKALAASSGLDLICLLTPTSGPDRVAAVREAASGFVYYVSRTGVTGASSLDLVSVGGRAAEIRHAVNMPVCVGFGISRPEQVSALRDQADGVVVGSALVEWVEKLGRGDATIEEIADAVRALKNPLRGRQ